MYSIMRVTASKKAELINGVIVGAVASFDSTNKFYPVAKRHQVYVPGQPMSQYGVDSEEVVSRVENGKVVCDSNATFDVDDSLGGMSPGIYYGRVKTESHYPYFLPLCQIHLDNGTYTKLNSGKEFNIRCLNSDFLTKNGMSKAEYVAMYLESEIMAELDRHFVKEGDTVLLKGSDKPVTVEEVDKEHIVVNGESIIRWDITRIV